MPHYCSPSNVHSPFPKSAWLPTLLTTVSSILSLIDAEYSDVEEGLQLGQQDEEGDGCVDEEREDVVVLNVEKQRHEENDERHDRQEPSSGGTVVSLVNLLPKCLKLKVFIFKHACPWRPFDPVEEHIRHNGVKPENVAPRCARIVHKSRSVQQRPHRKQHCHVHDLKARLIDKGGVRTGVLNHLLSVVASL